MPDCTSCLLLFSFVCALLAGRCPVFATQLLQQQQQQQQQQSPSSPQLQSRSPSPPAQRTTSQSQLGKPRPPSPSTSTTRLVGKAIMGESGTEQEWLNAVMSQLAPRFSEFAAEVLNEQIEPLIKKVLKTSHLPVKFRFVKTDFGTVPPQITNLRTHKTPEGQEAKSVIVDFDFEYLGDCNLEVSILGIHSGVRDFQMSGRGRVVLKPTTKSLPLVGGLQLCFLEPPAINFDLEGIADLCDWPILRRKVRKEIREDTAKKSVYPNRLIIPMAGSVDAMHVKCFEPTGLVAVKIQSASNLPRKKGIRVVVGQDKPDPYVNVRVGAQVYKTSVIKNKANPVWPEEEHWQYFMLETPKGHRLRLDVFDKDSMSHDEFLGFARVNVEDYLGLEVPKTATVALENDPMENNLKKPVEVSGDVTFSSRWIPLVQANATELSNATAVVVTFFVYSCNNLVNMTQDGGIISDGNAPNTQLQVTLGSTVKEGEIKKKKFHPEFEECFTFLIPKQDISPDLVGKIDVKDVDRGEILGSLSMPLSDLASGPQIQRRIASLSPDNPYITITYSANIKMGV